MSALLTNGQPIPSTGDNSHGSGEWLNYSALKQEFSSAMFGNSARAELDLGGKIHNRILQKIKQSMGNDFQWNMQHTFPGWMFLSSEISSNIVSISFCEANTSAAAQNASIFYMTKYNKNVGLTSAVQTLQVPQSQNNNQQTTPNAPSSLYSSAESQQSSGVTSSPPTPDENELDIADQTLPSLTGKRANLGLGVNNFGVSTEASVKVTKARLDLQRSTLDTRVNNENPLNKSGIYSNRPSILLDSTYVNIDPEDVSSRASIRFDSSVLYNLIKKNFLKENLNFFKDESFEDYIEFEDLYKEFQFKIEEVITLIDEIDELKENFINSLDNYSETGLNSLGYGDDKVNPTKAFLQLTYEIGGYPAVNPHFLNMAKGLQTADVRNLGSDTNRSSETYSVTEPTLDYVLLAFWTSDLVSNTSIPRGIDHPGYRLAGDNAGSFLEPNLTPNNIPYVSGKYENTNTLKNVYSKASAALVTATGATLKDGNIGNILGPAIGNHVWFELYNSYVYYNSTSAEQTKLDKEKDNKNILYNIIGEDTLTDGLVSADNSSGIAKVLRYPVANTVVMPFELPGVSFESGEDSLASVTTGLEKWIDPNIGNVFEGEKVDYSSLDSWIDELDDFINSINKKIDPHTKSGGAQIIYNEIIRAFEYIANGNTSFDLRNLNAESASDWSDIDLVLMVAGIDFFGKFEAFEHDLTLVQSAGKWIAEVN